MEKIDFNCYGESLDSTPDFLSSKRYYEENLLLEELNNSELCSKFDTPNLDLGLEENKHISLIKENKVEYDKETTKT